MSSYLKEKYTRSKPHMNIATIGDISNGKTTLTAAILKVLVNQGKATQKSYDKIISMVADNESVSNKQCHVVAVEYETDTYHYAHLDCAGSRKFVKNTIASIASVDGAILVVSASEGITVQTRQYLKMIREIIKKNIFIFINKIEGIDQQQLERIENELKELLESWNYSTNTISIVRGSASLALQGVSDETSIGAIEKLLQSMDTTFSPQVTGRDRPFSIPIISAYSIPGRGTVAVGRVKSGSIRVAEEVEIHGYGTTTKTVVTGVQTFNKQMEEAIPGDFVGLLLRGVQREGIRRGQVICKPGSRTLHKEFKADISVLQKENGGRHTPFFRGYQPQLFSGTCSMTASITLLDGAEMVMPNDQVQIEIRLPKGIIIDDDDPLLFCEGNRLIGSGTVIKIIQ